MDPHAQADHRDMRTERLISCVTFCFKASDVRSGLVRELRGSDMLLLVGLQVPAPRLHDQPALPNVLPDAVLEVELVQVCEVQFDRAHGHVKPWWAFVGIVVAVISAQRLREGGKGAFDRGFGRW